MLGGGLDTLALNHMRALEASETPVPTNPWRAAREDPEHRAQPSDPWKLSRETVVFS